MRPGGRWELGGFVLILASIAAVAADEAGCGVLIGAVGIVVFLVGRFL